MVEIHPSWNEEVMEEFGKLYWKELLDFLDFQYLNGSCLPDKKDIFRAFDMTPFDTIKVVIVGQDPYHTPGVAMGLSFSIPDGLKIQPSLRNIFHELESDLSQKRIHTDLSDWAKQGVLLLNTVLTVREGEPASHQKKGWEIFTDRIITLISEKKEGIVFILWGAYAISKSPLIDREKHCIISSPHPSPFSAHKGFFGSRPFSRTNEYLEKGGKKKIIWE